MGFVGLAFLLMYLIFVLPEDLSQTSYKDVQRAQKDLAEPHRFDSLDDFIILCKALQEIELDYRNQYYPEEPLPLSHDFVESHWFEIADVMCDGENPFIYLTLLIAANRNKVSPHFVKDNKSGIHCNAERNESNRRFYKEQWKTLKDDIGVSFYEFDQYGDKRIGKVNLPKDGKTGVWESIMQLYIFCTADRNYGKESTGLFLSYEDRPNNYSTTMMGRWHDVTYHLIPPDEKTLRSVAKFIETTPRYQKFLKAIAEEEGLTLREKFPDIAKYGYATKQRKSKQPTGKYNTIKSGR